MKLRITSDGTSAGTFVTTEDGERVEGVQEVTWHVEPGSRARAEVTLRVRGVEVDVSPSRHDA